MARVDRVQPVGSNIRSAMRGMNAKICVGGVVLGWVLALHRQAQTDQAAIAASYRAAKDCFIHFAGSNLNGSRDPMEALFPLINVGKFAQLVSTSRPLV